MFVFLYYPNLEEDKSTVSFLFENIDFSTIKRLVSNREWFFLHETEAERKLIIIVGGKILQILIYSIW
jgi:hypothetical protein